MPNLEVPQPVYPDWGQQFGGAISKSFDAIMQGLAQRQANQQQAGFALADNQPTPQQAQQFSQLAQQFPQITQPGQTGQPQAAPQGMNPQQQDVYQQFMGFRNNAQQMMNQQKQLIQSQINKNNNPLGQVQVTQPLADANPNLKGLVGQRLPASTVNTMIKPKGAAQDIDAYKPSAIAVHNGQEAPSQAYSKFGTSATMFSKAYYSMYPNDSLEQKEIDYQTKLKGGTSEASASGSLAGKLKTAIGGAQGSFKILQDNYNQMSPALTQKTNSIYLQLAAQSSDKAQSWISNITTAQLELARAIAGGNDPGEIQMEKAEKILPLGITPQQFPQVMSRIQKQYGNILSGAQNPSQFSGQQPQQQGQQQGMVKVVSPSGQPGMIPAANLQKALSQGYTQAQ